MEPPAILVKNLIRDFRVKLSGIYPDSEILQVIYLLFEEYLGWKKTRVHLSYDIVIPSAVMKSFNLALEELQSGKPIQYIIGKSWFNGLPLKVDSNVLVPRPETEELCSMIKADYTELQEQMISILDIGTGSGCIAIDLKKHFTHAMVTAVDYSTGALKVASENARANNCEISFIHANILDPETWNRLGRYHLIVSNPPYVLESEKKQMHRNVIAFEPGQALFVDDNDPLLFYRSISDFSITHMVTPARLYFEINERFGTEVSQLIHSRGFDEVNIIKDFQGKERFVSGLLTSQARG